MGIAIGGKISHCSQSGTRTSQSDHPFVRQNLRAKA